jgi:hypothetical protein
LLLLPQLQKYWNHRCASPPQQRETILIIDHNRVKMKGKREGMNKYSWRKNFLEDLGGEYACLLGRNILTLETQRKKVYLIDMKYSLNDAQRHQIT